MKRRLAWLAGAAWLALTSGAVCAAEHPIVHVSLLTAPFSTGSYVLGAALQDISNKSKSWVRIDASESPGFIFNVKKLASDPDARRTTIVGSGKGVLALAEAGAKPFDKKYPGLKLICNYNLVALWLATLDPHVQSVNDLAGKRVGLGRAAQINWGVEPERMLRVGWGLGPDKVSISYLGPKEAVSALLDGHVDAAILGGYMNPGDAKLVLSPQTTQFMASNRAYHFLPWGKEQVEKTIASGMNVIYVDLPPNAIPGVAHDMPVFADTVGWFVSADFPQDVAYEVTKLIIDNVTKFAEYSAAGKLMSAKSLTYGFEPKDIAPGALKAYREAGILK